jgi:hypothetical protein
MKVPKLAAAQSELDATEAVFVRGDAFPAGNRIHNSLDSHRV